MVPGRECSGGSKRARRDYRLVAMRHNKAYPLTSTTICTLYSISFSISLHSPHCPSLLPIHPPARRPPILCLPQSLIFLLIPPVSASYPLACPTAQRAVWQHEQCQPRPDVGPHPVDTAHPGARLCPVACQSLHVGRHVSSEAAHTQLRRTPHD